MISIVPTGIFLEIPTGFDAEIRPRSGLSTKHRVIIPNSPGTIDSDYRGEILVPLLNLGDTDFTVSSDMRIAQLVLRTSISIEWSIAEELDQKSVRGDSGFGSTGVK
ncbi:MAG: dUTP diphosphatase [Leptospira sp.]|nr:dUTP diphosphatase [Leptospira sp.]